MQVVVGTAGHIDHGKTSIVKALTGTDTDGLIEEKKRGLTIDLGFAYLDERITIIDVPGHEKFIKNMVAGVSTIHIGLIVIAADDGIMPQTYEHIEILNFLNVKHAIIVLNKVDLVDDEWIELIEKDIKSLVSKTKFVNPKIIKTSTLTNQGIKALTAEIKSLSKKITQKYDRGIFYLPVDRVFSKVGYGTVVTGTVISGRLKAGSTLKSNPGNHDVVVRSLQSHGKKVDRIRQGDRAALNFSNVDRSLIRRGAVISEKNTLDTTSRIIAHIQMSTKTKWKIKNKQFVHMHVGTSQIIAKVITYGKSFGAGDEANAVLMTDEPIAVLNDQYFILRSLSPMETIAGCKVLDHDLSFSNKELKDLLPSIEFELSNRIIQTINFRDKTPLSMSELSQKFNISGNQILKILEKTNVLTKNNLFFSKSNLQKSKQQVYDTLINFHKENPYKDSFSIEELVGKLGFSRKWFDCVIDELGTKLVKTKGGMALPGRKIVFEDSDKQLAEKIEKKVELSEFSLISYKDLSLFDAKKSPEILHALKSRGKIFQVSSELWIHKNALTKMIQMLCNYFDKENYLTVSEFKTLTNTTRKSAIPLLEFCDKSKFTFRENNVRTIGERLNDAQLS